MRQNKPLQTEPRRDTAGVVSLRAGSVPQEAPFRYPRRSMICVNTNFLVDPLPDYLPKFVPGEIVEHIRDGYRAVIVAVDGHCKADPAWYMASSPHADRDQPWYFVLVDGSTECVYPPEEDLRPAMSLAPIRHPLLWTYFERFVGSRYLRNDFEWEGI